MEPEGQGQIIVEGDHAVSVHGYRAALLQWGGQNIRTFPWRQTRDPYLLLVAEIMLHRTQVRQVIPVYQRFVERYPDVHTLAKASIEQLRKELRSLGLLWRIDLFHSMAIELENRYGGQVPADRQALLSLPGVSDYIASAVRCFAYGHPDPLIDTNTVRVTGRVFGLRVLPSSRRNRTFGRLIAALVDPEFPDVYNYSILDLAHLVCHGRVEPDCLRCPLLPFCRYGMNKVVECRPS